MFWSFRRPVPRPATTRRPRVRLTLEALEERMVPATAFQQTNLVSDVAGMAQLTDPHLKNPWGVAVNPGGDFWVSNIDTGTVTLYHGDVNGSAMGLDSPVITVPPAAGGTQGTPTGQVYNPTSTFQINGTPAFFIFATQDGTISAVTVNFYTGISSQATLEATTPGASYTGLALASNGAGTFLYAANNAGAGSIDVFDSSFHATTLAGHFTDPNLPSGFTPFNITALGSTLYVTYENPQDEAHGGVVDKFDANGNLLGRFAGGSNLVAPWGVVQAPADFGSYGGDILVGNFGDGRINAYDTNGNFLGQLQGQNGQPIVIARLWALFVGNGVGAGDTSKLYFTAGLNQEQDGLLGSLQPVSNSWRVTGETVGSDGNTRLLWTKGDGTAVIWSVNSTNNLVNAGPGYGPFAGWTATKLAAGSDGNLRLLWDNANGQTSLWLLDGAGDFLSAQSYGAAAGWTATDISVGSDGNTRLLWDNVNGAAVVWNVNTGNGQVAAGPTYVPSAGWTATRLTAGADGKTRLLWNQVDGAASLWLLDANGNFLNSFVYGAFVGWTAGDISVGSDGNTRILWTNSNGTAILWSINTTNGQVSTGPLYGAVAGWRATHITAGADGKTRLLWENLSGQEALWFLDANGNFLSAQNYGPF